MNVSRPILLVEDDDVDIMIVKRALNELNVKNTLLVANNGEEALEILQNPYGGSPCIILLDLNMPKMNGIEFLRIAKNNEQLKRIPVVVLTTSHEEVDKIESYNLGVAGYMVKPVEYIEFVEVVKTIDLYWTLSKIPDS